MRRFCTLFVLALLLWPLPDQAQEIRPDRPLLLSVDYARFHYDDQNGYLELYFAFHPKLLTYRYANGLYHGGLQISTRIANSETGQVLVEEVSSYPINQADTSAAWYQYWIITQAGFALPFGQYQLQVVAIDSLARTRTDTVAFAVLMQDFGEDTRASDLQLCKSISRAGSKNNVFVKNSLEVVPNPTLIYGMASYPVMFSYIEMYNLLPDRPYTIRRQILDANGKVVREVTRKKNYTRRNVVDIGSMPVTSFPSGRYRFKFSLLDETGTEQMAVEKPFLVINPKLQLTGAPDKRKIVAALAALSASELDHEFETAGYVATDQEKRLYQQLDNVAAKREFLADFWFRVMQGRIDVPPVNRRIYLQRVKMADEKFTKFNRQGWATDRGRVLILYGEPDEVYRYPSEGGTKPYEVWRYYNIEKGAEFVFVDRTGYGDYELVHSTKRGELFDPNWERYLR
ncbi:MAG: GWxTD domain-containing protein [candidate division KSB1 bacterium]|nr:GWxTD domain-containing protein [candidate division KSB1 bacterium]MDQ7065267.1 GWxTD domain-containing protein [candidate division KSB1 bacterium]